MSIGIILKGFIVCFRVLRFIHILYWLTEDDLLSYHRIGQTLNSTNFQVTMSHRQNQRDLVHGYVRLNCNHDNMVEDIINIIYEFYLIQIDSSILSSQESTELLDLLYKQLQKQDQHKDLKSIDAGLLFRASEYQFNAVAYHNACDGKTTLLTIIQNQHDKVFGGYAAIPLTVEKPMSKRRDLNAFLFAIRPFVKCYELIEGPGKGGEAVYGYRNYGPIFGRGEDIFISDRCHKYTDKSALGNGQTFEIKVKDFYPNHDGSYKYFSVKEYEIFKLVLK